MNNMLIKDNNIIVRGRVKSEDKIIKLEDVAIIGIYAHELPSVDGAESKVNFYLEVQTIDGERFQCMASKTTQISEIYNALKDVKRELVKNGKNSFTNIASCAIVNLEHVQDVKLINKGKGFSINFKDFEVECPQVGKFTAKRAIKKYKSEFEKYQDSQIIENIY